MDKNDLKIRIKNIGSIENVSFTIKDITGILGLPNSGKSYALRSIYWFLQLLDKNRYSEIIDMIKEDMPYYDIIDFISIGNNNNVEDEIKDIISNYIANTKSYKKLNQHEILYGSELQFEFHLNTDNISKLIKSTFKNTMQNYLNSKKLDSIEINGINMDKIIDEINLDIFNDKDSIFPSEKIESVYIPLPPAREQDIKKYLELRRFLSGHPIKMSIDNIKYDYIGDNITINFDLKLTRLITNENHITSRHTYGFIDDERVPFGNKNNQYINSIISKIKDNIIDFYLKSIKLYVSNISGLNSIKFIPYGRNIIVQLYNNSKKERIFEPPKVLDTIQNLKNAPFSSYFKWIDDGYSSIDNFNENIKSLFQFIIKGSIDINTNSGGLKYTYSKDKSVDLNLSSAMVEEIAGIMLPVISSHEGDLIIIEEPEAQLHITTQIIMGILLIYIAKELNMKILFSTHSDTMTFIIQHILSNHIQDNDIKQLMKTIYKNNNVPDIKLNLTNNKFNERFSFYYINKGKSEEYNSKDLQNSIPGISNVIDDLFNWAFNSLKDPKNGDKN